MDLEFHGRRDFADLVTKRYIEHSGDEGLMKLLPFYKCYRAYVRAKVAGFKILDTGITKKEKEVSEDLIKRYFKLSLDHAKVL